LNGATSRKELAEARLQAAAKRIAAASDFAALHGIVEREIGSIRGIGTLTVYDIAHRLGAHFGKAPALVYLHAGTRKGAEVFGLSGDSIDPRKLPSPFSRLSPAEIEDWQGRLLDLFKDMKVKQCIRSNDITVSEARKQLAAKGGKFAEGHAHRFHDTFAVELPIGWGATRTRVDTTRAFQRKNHREALRAMGPRTAGTGGSGRSADLGAGSRRAPRNEGYARGTRKTQVRELIENGR